MHGNYCVGNGDAGVKWVGRGLVDRSHFPKAESAFPKNSLRIGLIALTHVSEMAKRPSPLDTPLVASPPLHPPPKPRKAKPAARPRTKVVKMAPLTDQTHADNRWVKNFGTSRVEAVYECATGGVWVLFERKRGAPKTAPRVGLVSIPPCDPEYGGISNEELESSCGVKHTQISKIFTSHLPCTLSELFEKTPVWTYFS